jgi:predicted permease
LYASELWRLSKKVYREIAFQSVFSLRMGETMPQMVNMEENIRKLTKSAEFNMVLSKCIMAFFICFTGAFTFLSGALSGIDESLATMCGVSTILSVVLLMMVFMGLQATTAFISSRIAELLVPLSISRKDISKILLMCFIRIFDIPLATAVLILPLIYGVSYSSVFGTLTVFLSIVVTEIFALAITVFLAFFFYSKVVRGGGKSTWRTFLRLFYMLVWIIPMFFMYMVPSLAMQMVNLMKTVAQNLSYLLTLIYPFSLGSLTSLTTFLNISNSNIVALSLGSSSIYFALAAYSLKWLVKRVVGLGFGSVAAGSRVEVKEVSISPASPWLGIIKKDLRIASRSPSYFSILVMPIIQIIIFSISFSSIYSNASEIPIGFLPSEFLIVFMFSLWMVLMLPPMLLNMESIAYSYVVSLPLKRKTLIIAKTVLSSIIYLTSLLVLLSITMLRAPVLTPIFALLGGIFTFSIVASIIVEILLLSRVFGRSIPSNLYSKLYAYILPLILSFIVASVPILVYFIILFLTAFHVASMVSLTATSILEFLIALLFISRRK